MHIHTAYIERVCMWKGINLHTRKTLIENEFLTPHPHTCPQTVGAQGVQQWGAQSHAVPHPHKERKNMEHKVKTVLEASGYRIPPYRMAKMAKTISKIMELITCDVSMGYTSNEARYMLQLAETMVTDAEEDRWS